MGNSDHGTAYMRAGGDDGELRPEHYIQEGRRGRRGTPTMALHIRKGNPKHLKQELALGSHLPLSVRRRLNPTNQPTNPLTNQPTNQPPTHPPTYPPT